MFLLLNKKRPHYNVLLRFKDSPASFVLLTKGFQIHSSLEIGNIFKSEDSAHRTAMLQQTLQQNEAIIYWLKVPLLAASSHLPIHQLVISIDTTGTTRLAGTAIASCPCDALLKLETMGWARRVIRFSSVFQITN